MRPLQRLRLFSGTWPFGVVELIWSGIAVRRWLQVRAEPARHRPAQ